MVMNSPCKVSSGRGQCWTPQVYQTSEGVQEQVALICRTVKKENVIKCENSPAMTARIHFGLQRFDVITDVRRTILV